MTFSRSSSLRLAKASASASDCAMPTMQSWFTILVSWPEPGAADQGRAAWRRRRAPASALSKVGLVAAAHDAELAVDRAGLAAGHRRVDEADALLLGLRHGPRGATVAEAVVWSTRIAPFCMPASAPLSP